jgi:F0F1-type ATP synthase assembly protein I
MQDTIAALFKDEVQAESAVRALRSAHFDSTRTMQRQAGENRTPDSGSYAARGIEAGCVGGTVVGVLLGVLAAGLLPHSHPFLPGGLFVPFILGIAFGATGGLIGLLLSISAWHEAARLHQLDVQSGRYLVSVEADPERRDTARRILLSQGAITAWPAGSSAARSGRPVVE